MGVKNVSTYIKKKCIYLFSFFFFFFFGYLVLFLDKHEVFF